MFEEKKVNPVDTIDILLIILVMALMMSPFIKYAIDTM